MHIVSRVGIGKIPPLSPLYLDVGGAVNFDSTLRVIGKTTVNSLISAQLTTNTTIFESRIVGEANVLFSINRDGRIEWGSGDPSSTDVNLYRSTINTLRTNGSFIIDQSLFVGDSTSDTASFVARISSNFDPSVNNTFSLGQDSLRWQNLWLSVKLTSVDGLFTGDLQIDNNAIIGSSVLDTLTVNALVSSQLTPSSTNLYDLGSLTNKWRSLFLGSNLQVDGNTILGDSTSDTVTFNASAASSLITATTNLYDLGSLTNKWRSLFLGSNLQVDGNTILGDSTADTLTVNAFVNSQLTPYIDNTHNLGSLSNRWSSLFLGSNLQVDGNTILGDSPADTVTINAGFTSPINPSIDNFYNLGTSAFRWKNINLGPEGLIVRNDNTNTQKVSLFFNTGTAYLGTSSGINLFVTTNNNNGILVDSSGKVGINSTGGLVKDFSVVGTSDFSDTAYFSKSSGYGLNVVSVAGIQGSIESSNLTKELNIGINAETEFVNLGTGNLTKTINIGTGSGKTTINIGGPSDIININGTVTTTQTIESLVADKTFTLNAGGLNNTAQNSGLIVEEASSLFLVVSDPTWQGQNTVRFIAPNTGNIKVGSIILIAGFFQNNGQFVVSGLSTNSYIEVQNPQVSDNSKDEIGISGTCTNPQISGKILISSDRSGWEIYSPLNSANSFKLTNLGANVELKSSVSGLSVVASALIPETPNTPLGSISNLWDGYLNNLNVYGNSIIGDQPSDTLTVNSLSSFIGKINSDFIPNTNITYSLGSLSNKWLSLYSNNIYAYGLSTLDGTVNLGSLISTQINVAGRFISDLIPNASTFNLGSLATPWNSIYINSVVLPLFSPGSILFIDSSNALAQNNSKFFWDQTNNRLYIGQNTGSYILDIASAGVDSIRLRNTADSSAVAFRADSAAVKIAFTNKLQFGANSYANVGNGSATPVMELTNNSVSLLGAVSVNSVSVGTATYTVQSTDVIINIDTMSSGCVITLPSAATKRILVIKDIGNNASAANRSIQLAPALNQYIEFNPINIPFVIERDGESVTLQSDGNNRWYII